MAFVVELERARRIKRATPTLASTPRSTGIQAFGEAVS